MTITMGQLVAGLYTRYEEELQDSRLAAIATQVRVQELLGQAKRKSRPRGRRPA
jgi:hypothetical protein